MSAEATWSPSPSRARWLSKGEEPSSEGIDPVSGAGLAVAPMFRPGAPAWRQAWYHAQVMPKEVKNTVEHQHQL